MFQLLVEFEVGRAVVRADERVTIELPDAPVVYQLLSSGTARTIEMFTMCDERLHMIAAVTPPSFQSSRQTIRVSSGGAALRSSIGEQPVGRSGGTGPFTVQR